MYYGIYSIYKDNKDTNEMLAFCYNNTTKETDPAYFILIIKLYDTV